MTCNWCFTIIWSISITDIPFINGFIVERLNEVGNRIAVAVAVAVAVSTCFEMFNDLMDCIG